MITLFVTNSSAA